LGAADRIAYAPFEARATAQKFGDIFDGLREMVTPRSEIGG
jgi:hypothetical protein